MPTRISIEFDKNPPDLLAFEMIRATFTFWIAAKELYAHFIRHIRLIRRLGKRNRRFPATSQELKHCSIWLSFVPNHRRFRSHAVWNWTME